MRYRVKDYTIEGQMIILPYEITLEDLRLLTNETQEISLCSSMFKNKALIKKDGIWTEIPNAISISGNIITVTLEACTLQPTDKLTIEIDKGDNLSSVENKMEEESLTILNKIDNIDLSTVAKQGENQDATNTAIYALLSQFGDSVLQEAITVICNCAEDIAWEEYGVVITYSDGTSQSLPMSENGTCSFSVKIGQEYSVQLPVIGAYIAPTLKTYMASTSSRQIYWSYVISGVFGLDELGRRYTIEQIEALEDKSIIKYGGFTNEYLENYQRADGSVGCGVMWDLNNDNSCITGSWRCYDLSTELIPYSSSLSLCDGKSQTNYMISEGIRLSDISSAANAAIKKIIIINDQEYQGFIPAIGQLMRLCGAYYNKSSFLRLYNVLSLTPPNLYASDATGDSTYTSNHNGRNTAVNMNIGGDIGKTTKHLSRRVFVVFDLPK